MELIRIQVNEKMEQIVSAKELHEKLEIGTDFSTWFKRMCEYGFTEDVDFTPFLGKSLGGRPSQDFIIKIDMAKELAMLQRTEKGKEVRKYFIEIEKSWNNPEQIMARALQIANRTIDSFKFEVKQLENKIEEDKPKVRFAEAVETAKNSILVREMAKILTQNDCKIGEKSLFQWLRENGYLIKKIGTDYNLPTQKAMEMKLFEIKETAITRTSGSYISRTPKITGKGQLYFLNKILKMI
ncbi:MAG: phage antirepressor KilAC domain-containing protein [Cetobacterium sp.]